VEWEEVVEVLNGEVSGVVEPVVVLHIHMSGGTCLRIHT